MIYALLIFIVLSIILFFIVRAQSRKAGELQDEIQDLESENEMLLNENARLQRLNDEFKDIEGESDAKKKKLHSGSSADNARAATDAMSKLSRSRNNRNSAS